MGGGWNYPGTPLVRIVMWEAKTTSVVYGPKDWPSHSERLWIWEAV